MENCELLQGCLFFNDKMANMPATAGLYKREYCLGCPVACARYRVAKALGRPCVPADLCPNQGDRARQIIALA